MLKKKFTILEFSKLSGIKRENLRFYDRIGLLSPETRGENKYRYYSRHQLNTAYLISSLRWIGVGIEEIKKYADERSPEKAIELYAQQEKRIAKEIEKMEETRKILRIHSDMMKEAINHEHNEVFLEKKSKEAIFVCPIIPEHLDNDEAEIFSYDYAEEHGINPGYPLGARLAQRMLETGDTTESLQYYFKAQDRGNAWKPDGLYAVAYGEYDPWHSEPLYRRLLKFINEQGMIICGDGYEEYPLNDISIKTPDCYGIRIEIPVKPITIKKQL